MESPCRTRLVGTAGDGLCFLQHPNGAYRLLFNRLRAIPQLIPAEPKARGREYRFRPVENRFRPGWRARDRAVVSSLMVFDAQERIRGGAESALFDGARSARACL